MPKEISVVMPNAIKEGSRVTIADERYEVKKVTYGKDICIFHATKLKEKAQ